MVSVTVVPGGRYGGQSSRRRSVSIICIQESRHFRFFFWLAGFQRGKVLLQSATRGRIGVERALGSSLFDRCGVEEDSSININNRSILGLFRLLLLAVQQQLLEAHTGVRQVMKPEQFALQHASNQAEGIVVRLVCAVVDGRGCCSHILARNGERKEQKQRCFLVKCHPGSMWMGETCR